MISLERIISNSGDSVIDSYNYADGVLTIALSINELEKDIILKIQTDHIVFNSHYLNSAEEPFKTCYIDLEKLDELLAVENNIYIPAKLFGALMKEARANYNLAYGKEQSEFKYLFSLIGYDRLISCLVRDVEAIQVEG